MMQIKGNIKLRKLFTKSLRYGENISISWEGAKASIIKCLNDCIDTWSNRYDIVKSIVSQRKYNVINKVD